MKTLYESSHLGPAVPHIQLLYGAALFLRNKQLGK